MEPDFSKRQHFPGTTGTPFDTFLHGITAIEKTPLPLFILVLFILALVPNPLDWRLDLVRWIFFLGDWLLLASLPRFHKSFGPPKPPVLVLALLRTVINLLPPWLAIPLQVVGTGLVIYAFWFEPHHPGLTKQTFRTDKLKTGTIIRVMHLADLHVERLTGRETLVNQMIKDVHPDLILFSGDMINLSYLKDRQAWEDARKVMAEWKAPAGVFSVTGSPAVDLPEIVPELVDGLPMCLLKNETRTIPFGNQEIELVGISCTHKPFIDRQPLDKLPTDPLSRFRILLYHSPDLAPAAARAGIDLQLSGHTHGGQVRLPWFGALFTGSLYGKRFEMGKYQLDKTTLYVSRGIGLEGAGAPRVRFLCPPEVILWEIIGTGTGAG